MCKAMRIGTQNASFKGLIGPTLCVGGVCPWHKEVLSQVAGSANDITWVKVSNACKERTKSQGTKYAISCRFLRGKHDGAFTNYLISAKHIRHLKNYLRFS